MAVRFESRSRRVTCGAGGHSRYSVDVAGWHCASVAFHEQKMAISARDEGIECRIHNEFNRVLIDMLRAQGVASKVGMKVRIMSSQEERTHGGGLGGGNSERKGHEKGDDYRVQTTRSETFHSFLQQTETPI